MRASSRPLRLVAFDLHDLAPATVDARSAELAAPDAAGVEAEQVGAIDQAERRPVPERDRRARGLAPGCLEPRRVAGGRGVDAVLAGELERAVGGDEAD